MMMSQADETRIRALYSDILDAWNQRNATAFAVLFDEDCTVIGFDGSQMSGPIEVEATLSQIFTHHQTAAYVAIVREVRLLAADVGLLRAVVGMVPAGQADINPAVNAIQTLVAVRRDEQWRISLFQNTPAQFHGRPEAAQQLTEELRALLK